MVNAAEPGGLDSLVERVAHLESDPETFASTASAPILMKTPDLGPILRAIADLRDPWSELDRGPNG